ncbi:MAG: hypothetical protein QNK92_09185 [Amylibacter sp.]
MAAISIPTQIINLGEEGEIPAAVQGATFIKELPNAQIDYITHANHFSFLGECSMRGPFLIKMAGEDPICSETGNRARTDFHEKLKDRISGFLNSSL